MSSCHSHVILAYFTGSMMSTFYSPVAEESLACFSKLEAMQLQEIKSVRGGEERSCHHKPVCSFNVCLRRVCVLTSSHPTASDNSLEG